MDVWREVQVPAEALQVARDCGERVRQLTGLNWASTEQLRSILLTSPTAAGPDLQETAARLGDCLAIARMSDGPGTVLERSSMGYWSVQTHPTPLEDYYFDDQLTAVEDLIAGNQAALERLGTGWKAEFTIDLATPLRLAQADVEWRVILTPQPIEAVLGSLPWWQLTDLFPAETGTLVVVVLQDGPERVEAPALVLATHDALDAPLRIVESRLLREELRRRAGQDRPSLPTAEEVHGMSANLSSLAPSVELLNARSAAIAWSWLSNSCRIGDELAELEFVGIRSNIAHLPKDGLIEPASHPGVWELYEWVRQDDLPDRFTAIRQVAALQDPKSLLKSASQVRRAADPIFIGLRSEAVSEVLKTQREARAASVMVARQTLVSRD